MMTGKEFSCKRNEDNKNTLNNNPGGKYNMINFKANGFPLLIGSLPVKNHQDAAKLVLDYTPDIPLWVQLPKFKKEGMISQFLSGLPGFDDDSGIKAVF